MPSKNRSLIWDVLLRTLLVAVILMILLSASGYFLNYSRQASRTLSELERSISERVQRESVIFDLARDNLAAFKEEFLRLYLSEEAEVTQADFERLYYTGPEGAMRMRRKYFDGVHTEGQGYVYGMSSFIGNNQSVEDPDFRRRLVLSYRLLAQLGPGFQTRFANTHVSFPENGIVLFWPEVPWGLQARADLPMNELGTIAATLQKNNPEREPVWTGLYYDETAGEWVITYEVPVDHDGRHLINPSHDVPLTDLMERLIAEHREGSYNFIIRRDGYLVAHPSPPAEEQKWVGQLSLEKIENESVVRSYELIDRALQESPDALSRDSVITVENERDDVYLTVGKLRGPEWLFVNVYPKSRIRAAAHRAAMEWFVEGSILLLVILSVFLVLVSRRANRPLEQLRAAAQHLGDSRYDEVVDGSIPLPTELNNEIGLLARRFQEMATRIRDANREMERVVDERTRELQAANAALREMSIMDGLTGIHNRRSFDRDFAALIREAEAGQGTFSLVMLDLDHFKLYNDTYGHSEGDRLLKRMSDVLSDSVREEDRVYRYGGEEFAILCPDTDREAAAAATERVLERVRSLAIPFPQSPHGVATISAGVAQYTPQASSGEALIKAADEKLYQAKHAGRDRLLS
jgi:diguanylate cyclase (GGDEF)-like protein